MAVARRFAESLQGISTLNLTTRFWGQPGRRSRMALDDQSASRGLVASLTEPDEVRALVLRYCEHGAGPASISEVSALEARTKPGLVVSQPQH